MCGLINPGASRATRVYDSCKKTQNAIMIRRSLRTTLAAVSRQLSTVSVGRKDSGESLGKRLFKLAYAKRSAVIEIEKWKKEGNKVQKYQLNRIVRELRKLKRYKHALEVCEWMTTQEDMKLMGGDYAVHLDLIAKVRGLTSAEKFFSDIPDKVRGPETCSALLHTYSQNKLIEKAEALMKKMSECGFIKNPLPFNHMLSLYISIGKLDRVEGVIQELRRMTVPDVVTYNLWLTGCSSQGDLETAEKVFLDMRKAKIDPDWVTYSTLTNLYIKKEVLDKAAFTLKEMEQRASKKSRNAYSSLISLHTSLMNKDEVHRVWNKMKSLFRNLNDVEYTSMISSLLKLGEFEEAIKIYSEWEAVSASGDPRIGNIIIAAFINKNQIEEAENFCNRMVHKKVSPCYTTWELLTYAHLKIKHIEKVLEYLEKAIGSVRKWNPDKQLLREIFNCIVEQADVEGAEQLLVLLRNAGHVSAENYKFLLRTYEKAGKIPPSVAERMETDNVEIDDETSKLMESADTLNADEG